MVFPSDYIMKIIEQFVQAIIRIIKLRKSGHHKEAIAQIQTASRFFLRADLHTLIYCSPDKILDQFRDLSGEINTQKCVLCADLLYELALVNEASQINADPVHLKTLCLNLYCFAIPKEEQFQTETYFAKVTNLISQLEDHRLSESIMANLRGYQQFLIDIQIVPEAKENS